MSITVHQSPTGYQSAHEEVWHVVESTNKSVAGFQYVFDIYDNLGNMLTRVKNMPYGADKLGVVDVGSVVRGLITDQGVNYLDGTELGWNTIIDYSTGNLFGADYSVRYGEVSGNVLTANLSSGEYRVFNRYNRPEWGNKSSNITGSMILSNRPQTSYYYSGQPVCLTAMYDENQTYLITEGESQWDGSATAGYINAVALIWSPTTDEATFTVSGSVSGTIGTRVLRKKCSKYDPHTLIFLNAFGGFDSFTFIHGKLTKEVERKSFEKSRYGLSGNSMVNKNDVNFYNESSKVYAVGFKGKMQLTSDLLSTDEYDWLFELIASPLVYYVKNGEYIPVTITDNNYEFKDSDINKTDSLVVTIDFGKSRNAQFR